VVDFVVSSFMIALGPVALGLPWSLICRVVGWMGPERVRAFESAEHGMRPGFLS
jgi:hypothetical protein